MQENSMTELESYYNKFNEEKRLDSRHGRVEFNTTMHYIHRALAQLEAKKQKHDIKIMDIGAGTGRYAVPLSEEGYHVDAVELVKHNLGILKSKKSKVAARQGNALNLKKYPDNEYDVTLLLGPMYHLFLQEEKVKALTEAKRITRPGGIIFAAYVMNEYGVITYAFKEGHLKQCIEDNRLTENFHTVSSKEDLYDYVRLEDIDRLNELAGMNRIKIISPDGPANYMRQYLNQLDEEEFEIFMKYQLATCERMDIIGAAAHTLDILRKD